MREIEVAAVEAGWASCKGNMGEETRTLQAEIKRKLLTAKARKIKYNVTGSPKALISITSLHSLVQAPDTEDSYMILIGKSIFPHETFLSQRINPTIHV